MFTVAEGNSFWPKCMHEPTIVLVVLSLFFVTHYRGLWVLRGSALSNKYKAELNAGFKTSARNRSQELHSNSGEIISKSGVVICNRTPLISGPGKEPPFRLSRVDLATDHLT